MNYKLIMLPNPILVSDEEIINCKVFDFNHNIISDSIYYNKKEEKVFKIIAGIEGLPTLDLSAIAEQIGWVDVEKLAEEIIKEKALFSRSPQSSSVDTSLHNARVAAFREGFKAAQSLNEKKYSEEDLRKAMNTILLYNNLDLKSSRSLKIKEIIQSISKPQEYNVLIETELVNQISYNGVTGSATSIQQPKITNNTIKVTKIV